MKSKNNIYFPDCWEEVKPAEWMHLLKMRWRLMERPGLSVADVKREWCVYVLKNRGYRMRRRVDDMLLVNELADTLGWMWRTEEDGVALTYDCTVNLIPEWRNLRGPISHGADLTFGEFRHAAAIMNVYNAGHDVADLRALCAILYRKTLNDGGCVRRELFRMERIHRYMGFVREMPEWLMWGVYAWFAYFCEYLFTGVFVIDGLELCFAPVFERSGRDTDGNRGKGQNLGMNSVLYSVAESGIFGNADDTDNTPLLRVMMKLLDDRQRADEMMRNLKK